jgi:NADPH2:quinone reductase
MRAVQITRFGDPEVIDVRDIPEPEAGPEPQLNGSGDGTDGRDR